MAETKYKLGSIENIINNTCVNLLRKILSDNDHPLTMKIPKVAERSTALFRFQPTAYNKVDYQNSFVQKFIRILRDGGQDRYTSCLNPITNNRAPASKQHISPKNKIKKQLESTPCPKCNKLFKKGAGQAGHLRSCTTQIKSMLNKSTQPPSNNTMCTKCERICKSSAGLASHQRTCLTSKKLFNRCLCSILFYFLISILSIYIIN